MLMYQTDVLMLSFYCTVLLRMCVCVQEGGLKNSMGRGGGASIMPTEQSNYSMGLEWMGLVPVRVQGCVFFSPVGQK